VSLFVTGSAVAKELKHIPFITFNEWSDFSENETNTYISSSLESLVFLRRGYSTEKDYLDFSKCVEQEEIAKFINLVNIEYLWGNVNKIPINILNENSGLICKKYNSKGTFRRNHPRLITQKYWSKLSDSGKILILKGFIDSANYYNQLLIYVYSQQKNKSEKINSYIENIKKDNQNLRNCVQQNWDQIANYFLTTKPNWSDILALHAAKSLGSNCKH